MFKKKNRAKRGDFLVQKNVTVQKNELFSVRCVPNHKETRVAVVLSKKVAKKAVDRNTIKRKILHVIKKLQLPKNYTVIVYPKKTITSESEEVILDKLKAALQ